MKYIKQYENHVKSKKVQEIPVKEIKTLQVINESVNMNGDIFEVKTITEIPQSLINAFIKKAETNLGMKVRKTHSDSDIAESLVSKIIKMNLDIEKLNPSDFFGGQPTPEEQAPQEAPQAPQVEPTEVPQEAPAAEEAPSKEGEYQSTDENLPDDNQQL